MKRKIPVLLLCALLLIPILAASALADEGEPLEVFSEEALLEALNNGEPVIDIAADIDLYDNSITDFTVPDGTVLFIQDGRRLAAHGAMLKITISEGALVIVSGEAALDTPDGSQLENRGTLIIEGELNTFVYDENGEARCPFRNEGGVFGGGRINVRQGSLDAIAAEMSGCIDSFGSVGVPVRYIYEAPEEATDEQRGQLFDALCSVAAYNISHQVEIASDLTVPQDSELRFSLWTETYLAPDVTVTNNGTLNFLNARVFLDSEEDEDSASIVNSGFICFNGNGLVDERITVSGAVNWGTGLYSQANDPDTRICGALELDLLDDTDGDGIVTFYVLANVGDDDSFEGFAFTDHDEEGNLCNFTDRLDGMWLEPYEDDDVPEGYIAYELNIDTDIVRTYTVKTVSPLRWKNGPGSEREEWYNVLLEIIPKHMEKLFWFDFGDISSIDDDGRINTRRYDWECAQGVCRIGLGETLGNGCLAAYLGQFEAFYAVPSADLFAVEDGGEFYVSIVPSDGDEYGVEIRAERATDAIEPIIEATDFVHHRTFDAVIGEPAVGIYSEPGMDIDDLVPGDIDLSGLESDPVYYIYTPDTWLAPKNELSVSFGDWRQDENGDDWHHYPYGIDGVTIEPYDDGDVYDGEAPVAYCWRMTVSRDIDTFCEGEIVLYRCGNLEDYDYNEECGVSRWIRINPSYEKVLVWFWGQDAGIEFDDGNPYLVPSDENRALTDMFETGLNIPVGSGRWGCLARIEPAGEDLVFVPVHISDLLCSEALEIDIENIDGHGPDDEYDEKGYYVSIRANDVPDEELRVSDGERSMVIGAYRTPLVTVQNKEVLPGQDVDINIMLENEQYDGVAAMVLEVYLEWDGEPIEYRGADNGGLFDSMTEGSASTVLTQLLLDNEFNIEWSGKVATLHFRVPDEVPSGMHYLIRAEIPEEDGALNENGDRVEVNTCDGGIFVMFYLWGDADGNGSVTLRDLVFVRRYLAGLKEADELAEGADANNDGTVDVLDLTLLRRYLANYDYDLGSSSVTLGPGA